MNYLRASYATNDVMAETVVDWSSLWKRKGILAAELAQKVYDKVSDVDLGTESRS